MFTTLIVQPIFNLLVLIYALLPGHNFGLSIIIFTVIIRLLLWPLIKRQLNQAKLMRKIQPELRRIAKETKGDRVRQNQLQMELYKERGINPFSSVGVALLQLPILIGLYIGLKRVTNDPHQMVSFAYPALRHISWMEHLSHNIHLFDMSLFGVVNLSRAALGARGIYWPAMLIVIGSAITQYYQAKQLAPNVKEGRSLRAIMREAGSGRQADQQEVNAAVGQTTRFILPVFVFFAYINIASALPLYWFVGGLVAFIQQSMVLREDSEEMEDLSVAQPTAAGKRSGRNTADIPEAEVIERLAPSGTVRISRSQGSKTNVSQPPVPAKAGASPAASPKPTAKKLPRSKKRRRK